MGSIKSNSTPNNQIFQNRKNSIFGVIFIFKILFPNIEEEALEDMIDTNVIQEKIEQEYVDGGYSQGWGFLNSPKKTLLEANTAFFGLNPGGIGDHPSIFSQEDGSSYEIEKWEKSEYEGQAPLQLQVKALFEILDVEPKNVLAANLIPFRTPNWKGVDITRALQFAHNLWNPILTSRPFRIVVMGRDTEHFVVKLLAATHVRDVSTGWGKLKASFHRYEGGDICYLPHLSTYKIFNREKGLTA